jgi:hypothetical protein
MGPNRRAQERERAAARAAAEAKRGDAERSLTHTQKVPGLFNATLLRFTLGWATRPVRPTRNADGGAAVFVAKSTFYTPILDGGQNN